MAKSVPCPKCKQTTTLVDKGDGFLRGRCEACGTRFKKRIKSNTDDSTQKLRAPDSGLAPPHKVTPAGDADDSGLTPLEQSPSSAAEEPALKPIEESDYMLKPLDEPTAAAGDDDDLALQPVDEPQVVKRETQIPQLPPVKKPKRKSKSSDKAEAKPNMLLIGGGVAAGVIVLGALIGAAVMVFGGSGGSDPGLAMQASGNFKGTSIVSAPVTLDQPIEGARQGEQFTDAPPLTEPKPYEPPPPAESKEVGDVKTAGATATPGADDTKHWDAPIDPPPSESDYTIAADLEFSYGATDYPPSLAALNGPFAVISRKGKLTFEYNTRKAEDPTGKRNFITIYTLKDVPRDPLRVVDLRTGETAGEFNGNMPYWGSPAISPTAKYAIGPYYVPENKLRGNLLEENKESLTKLFIWERDTAADTPKTLDPKGAVSTYRFVSDTVAVVVIETPKRQLQIWDVVNVKQTAAVDLPNAWGPSPNIGGRWNMSDRLARSRERLSAVSPGGRYVAVCGGDQIALVSVPEAKVIGAVGVAEDKPVNERSYGGIGFSTPGDKLIVCYDKFIDQKTRLKRFIVWNAANGSRLQKFSLHEGTIGPITTDPSGENCFAAGTMVALKDRAAGDTGFGRLFRLPTSGPALVQSGTRLRSSMTLKSIGQSELYAVTAAITGAPAPRSVTIDRAPKTVVAHEAPASWDDAAAAFAQPTSNDEKFGAASIDSSTPNRLQAKRQGATSSISFSPTTDSRIEWAEFAADGQLLVVQDGSLSAWIVTDDSVACEYKTTGTHYDGPLRLSPDRRVLAASRLRSIDLVDTATGKCRNYLAVEAGKYHIVDIAISPSSRYLAALYAEQWVADIVVTGEIAKQSDSSFDARLAVWDLKDGTSRHADLLCDSLGFVAWVSDEHVCVGSKESYIYDMRLGAASLHFVSANPERIPKIAKSGDHAVLFNGVPASVSGERTEEQAAFFVDDRGYGTLVGTPIRLDIDLGDRSAGEKQGKKILKELQARGLTIGGGGCVLSVNPSIVSTEKKLLQESTKKVIYIPKIEYTWKVHDSSGRNVWSGKTTGAFAEDSSWYSNRWTLSDADYNFGRRDPRKAMAQEIMSSGKGLDPPRDFPVRWLRSGDEFIPTPQTMTWSGAPIREPRRRR